MQPHMITLTSSDRSCLFDGHMIYDSHVLLLFLVAPMCTLPWSDQSQALAPHGQGLLDEPYALFLVFHSYSTSFSCLQNSTVWWCLTSRKNTGGTWMAWTRCLHSRKWLVANWGQVHTQICGFGQYLLFIGIIIAAFFHAFEVFSPQGQLWIPGLGLQ